MKRVTLPSIALLLVAWLLAACGASTQGPATWVDRPLDGTHVPLASITIQAHASDIDGVASIEFYVSETMIASVPAGGGRLGQATIDWMPPGPGAYTVIARGIDNRGNFGTQANARIVVGEAISTSEISAPGPAEPIQTSPPAQAIEPAPPTGPSLSLKQNANCRTGPGTAYDNVDTLFQGQTAAIEGQNNQSTWFMVKKPSGHGNCWVSIISVEVLGDLSNVPIVSASANSAPPPVEQPGQPPVQVPPQQIQDTLPPSISNVSIDPTSIQQAGCGSPDTFTISATVTDPSGIGNVIYQINGPGPADGGEGYLLPVGGDSYRATVGPISGSTGNWSVALQAVDMANNSAQAGTWAIQISCIQ
jgi:hypothetical protein